MSDLCGAARWRSQPRDRRLRVSPVPRTSSHKSVRRSHGSSPRATNAARSASHRSHATLKHGLPLAGPRLWGERTSGWTIRTSAIFSRFDGSYCWFERISTFSYSGYLEKQHEVIIVDFLVELLSQLTTVRSRTAQAQSVSSQLQHLEMQLQSTRCVVDDAKRASLHSRENCLLIDRQQLERLPRRQDATLNRTSNAQPSSGGQSSQPTLLDYAGAVVSTTSQSVLASKTQLNTSNFLLSK